MLPSCFFCEGLSCLHLECLSKQDIFTEPSRAASAAADKNDTGWGGALIKIASTVKADREEHELFSLVAAAAAMPDKRLLLFSCLS